MLGFGALGQFALGQAAPPSGNLEVFVSGASVTATAGAISLFGITIPWPDSVPLGVLPGSYTEKPERNVATFTPPNAQERERNRSRIRTYAIGFAQWLSSNEYDTLLAFYRATLTEGVLPFTRPHPRTGAVCKFKFTDAPQIVAVDGIRFQVALKLRLLPSSF